MWIITDIYVKQPNKPHHMIFSYQGQDEMFEGGLFDL